MEFADYLRYFGALVFVLALIGLAALAVRRFGLGSIAPNKGRRLQLVESVMLDGRHRLCLVRRDGMEHLVVLSPQGATLVEFGIPGTEAETAS